MFVPKKQKNINEINIFHANKSIDRFHKCATVLAERALGIMPGNMRAYPMMFASGNEHMIVANSNKIDPDIVIPYIVNAAFTLELLLKVIIFYERQSWELSHDLISLYEKISADTKEIINNNFKVKCKKNSMLRTISKSVKNELGYEVKWTMSKVLHESSKAFESWRYAFDSELHNPSLYGYGEAYEVLFNVKETLRSKYESTQ
jgi:hypothetical protein